MKIDSRLASSIVGKDFIVTAEYLPQASADPAAVESCAGVMRDKVVAVNAADNHFSVAMSSLAASLALARAGIEPVLQLVTRDRNRIALQSDLLGAASLGIKNVLCLSGYHQGLAVSPQASNVYDIDSIQLVAAVRRMNEEGTLLNGTRIQGGFAMLIGGVANPYLKPLQLNIIRLKKKIAAGADFIQTQAVFDVETFKDWIGEAGKEGLTGRAAILAGVMPLASADEARTLRDTYTDYVIPDDVIKRLESAGNVESQRKEGIAICADIIKQLKNISGIRGIHILCGGNETSVPEIISATAI